MRIRQVPAAITLSQVSQTRQRARGTHTRHLTERVQSDPQNRIQLNDTETKLTVTSGESWGGGGGEGGVAGGGDGWTLLGTHSANRTRSTAKGLSAQHRVGPAVGEESEYN